MGEVLARGPDLVVGVGQVADQVAAEPAHLAAQRGEVLGPRAEVIEVEVPVVDPVGPTQAEDLESVPVGEDLLAEVVVGAECDLPQRRLEVVGLAGQPRPVEDGKPAHPEDVLPRVVPPDQVHRGVGIVRVAEHLPRVRVGQRPGLAGQVHRAVVDLVGRVGEPAAGHHGLLGPDLGVRVHDQSAVGPLDQLVELLDPGRLELHRGDEARREDVHLAVEGHEPVGEEVVIGPDGADRSAGRPCRRPCSHPGGGSRSPRGRPPSAGWHSRSARRWAREPPRPSWDRGGARSRRSRPRCP